MRPKHFTLLLWIGLFLLLGELALEYRAKKRGYGALLFDPAAVASVFSGEPVNVSAEETTAVDGFGPTKGFPFRSRVVDELAPDGTTRIMIASASYAEDRQQPVTAIFPVLLEDELRARGFDVEVLNASSNAYSLGTAARVLAEEGPRWKPDLVLAYHYSNDLDEIAPRVLSVAGGGAPNANAGEGATNDAAGEDDDDGTPRTERARPWPSRLMEATTAYAQAKNQLKARLVALRLLEPTLPPAVLAGLRERLDAVRAVTESFGAELVLVQFACSHPASQGGSLPAPYRNNLFRYNSYLSERAWREGVGDWNTLLAGYGAAHGLAVLDLPSDLAGRHECFRDFCHLTAEGHAVAARALADELEPLLAARTGQDSSQDAGRSAERNGDASEEGGQ